jgi:glycosyltransferase involved in cell wall biosynthesis
MVTVSAIVPTYRRLTLLERALGSIGMQDGGPDEVVVVNDGPEPDSLAIQRLAARVNCSRVAVISNARAQGASGARNTGAEHATGEWIAFLDDDDEWLPGYLRRVRQCIADGEVDVVCTDLLYGYDGEPDRPGKAACDRLAVESFLTRNPGLIGSNLAIRRALYMEIGGFDESLPCLNDMDFGMRLSLHGAVRYAPLRERLVRHHHHTGARLCTPRTDIMRTGIRGFYERYARRMTAAQHEEFGRSMRRLWGIDEHGELV